LTQNFNLDPPGFASFHYQPTFQVPPLHYTILEQNKLEARRSSSPVRIRLQDDY